MTIQHLNGRGAAAPASAIEDKSAPTETGGAYGWLTPYVSRLAAHNGELAARLLALPRAELHFIALCLALMGDKRNDADHLASFARALNHLPRRRILKEFAPAVDARLTKLCAKFAGRPWRPASYVRLAQLWTEPHARKTLRHLPHITRWRMIMLARLPPPYRKPGVMKMVKRRRDLPRVMFAIEIVRRVRTDLNDRQIIASLEKADTTYIRDWVEAHYLRLPFPKAPAGALSDGNGGVLRPVVTGAELTRAAHDFDNCVENYVWRAASGASVFYRYDIDGKPAAIAELKPVPGLGVAIDEALAPRNKELSGAVRSRLIGAFATAGILPAPQAAGPYAWFDLE